MKILLRDYYAGRGVYRDGSLSTPLLILDECLENPKISSLVELRFNEKVATEVFEVLEREVLGHPAMKVLKWKPRLTNQDAHHLIEQLEQEEDAGAPSFVFIDPYGFSDVRLTEVQKLIKPWGSDVLIYFDADRLVQELPKSDETARDALAALYGAERFKKLRDELVGIELPALRERRALDTFEDALKSIGARFVISFRLLQENGVRTSYYLVFATKDFKGYDEMKTRMRKESSAYNFSLETYQFSHREVGQAGLFETPELDPFIALAKDSILGMTLTADGKDLDAIYELLSVNKAFIRSDFKAALASLRNEGFVVVQRPDGSAHTAKLIGDTARIWLVRPSEASHG